MKSSIISWRNQMISFITSNVMTRSPNRLSKCVFTICEEIMNISQMTTVFHIICPNIFCPSQIATLQSTSLLSVSWKVFVVHRNDWTHWVSKSCTTIDDRILFHFLLWRHRDQLQSNYKSSLLEVLRADLGIFLVSLLHDVPDLSHEESLQSLSFLRSRDLLWSPAVIREDPVSCFQQLSRVNFRMFFFSLLRYFAEFNEVDEFCDDNAELLLKLDVKDFLSIFGHVWLLNACLLANVSAFFFEKKRLS